MPVKQVIVIRKDLKMRRGKEIAQGSHASISDLVQKVKSGAPILFDDAEKEWYYGSFRKICLYVNSEQELTDLYEKALASGLRVSKIVDRGLTEFNGVPTFTCIAIGPHYDEQIDVLTSNLSLY